MLTPIIDKKSKDYINHPVPKFYKSPNNAIDFFYDQQESHSVDNMQLQKMNNTNRSYF